MQRLKINDLHLWQFENLRKEASVMHFVTDRQTVEGEREFTLSFSSSPDREEIRQNRRRLAQAMGVDEARLFFPSQVHETKIVRVTRDTSTADVIGTDALITNEKMVCIAVMSADCVPVLLWDMKNQAVAAVHSGWRGTAARILEKTLQRMNIEFGTTGKDLVAGIGPSVSQASYEVGGEVVQAMDAAFGAESEVMIHKENRKADLDLWKANHIQLREFGVPESSVEYADLCTVKTNNYFFSARKGDTGRFAAGIMLI
ncbi:MAG TPA: peptidoglycan editing factor PgeF [Ohtaekwangia sp.]|nr:peptidoglycan editing factor PgeF [Ohtaekwangia sp.]